MKSYIWPWTSELDKKLILKLRKDKKIEHWRKLAEADSKKSRKVVTLCEAFLHKQFGDCDFNVKFRVEAWHAWKMGYEVNTAFSVIVDHESMISYYKGNFNADGEDYKREPHARVLKILREMLNEFNLEQRGIGSSTPGIQEGWKYKEHHVKFGQKGGCYYINNKGNKEYIPKAKATLSYEDAVMDCRMMEFITKDEEKFYRHSEGKRIIPQQELERLEKA